MLGRFGGLDELSTKLENMPTLELLLLVPVALFKDMLASSKALFNDRSSGSLAGSSFATVAVSVSASQPCQPSTSRRNVWRSRKVTRVERRRWPRTKGAGEDADAEGDGDGDGDKDGDEGDGGEVTEGKGEEGSVRCWKDSIVAV